MGRSVTDAAKASSCPASDFDRAKIADAVFNNDGDLDQLLRQAENIYEDVLLPRARASAQ